MSARALRAGQTKETVQTLFPRERYGLGTRLTSSARASAGAPRRLAAPLTLCCQVFHIIIIIIIIFIQWAARAVSNQSQSRARVRTPDREPRAAVSNTVAS